MELLVALTLMAILMTAMLGGLRLGARVWEVSSRNLEEGDRITAVRGFLRQRLEDVVPVIGEGDGGSDQSAFVGEPESLVLASSMPASLGEGLFLLNLALRPSSTEGQGSDLVVRWKPWPSPLSAEGEERMILDDVAGMTLTYYARSDEEPTGRWYPSWRGENLLPELIRVDLQFLPGDDRQWQPLIVSPMVDEWYDTGF